MASKSTRHNRQELEPRVMSWKFPQAPASQHFGGYVFPMRYPCEHCTGPDNPSHGRKLTDPYNVTLANEAARILEHAEGQIRRAEGMVAAGMLRDAARLCDLLEHRERALEEEDRKAKLSPPQPRRKAVRS